MIKICKFCNTSIDIDITQNQLNRINLGIEFIQNIMPYSDYTPGEIELFLSGMCDKCWDKTFADEDDDEEDLEYLFKDY